jgi:hypothetical protein
MVLAALIGAAIAAPGTPATERPRTAPSSKELRWGTSARSAGADEAAAGAPRNPTSSTSASSTAASESATDAGRTWAPTAAISRPGSIGASSDRASIRHHLSPGRRGLRRPDLSTGDGIHKSTDGGRGRIWGSGGGQQIAIAVVR